MIYSYSTYPHRKIIVFHAFQKVMATNGRGDSRDDQYTNHNQSGSGKPCRFLMDQRSCYFGMAAFGWIIRLIIIIIAAFGRRTQLTISSPPPFIGTRDEKEEPDPAEAPSSGMLFILISVSMVYIIILWWSNRRCDSPGLTFCWVVFVSFFV